MSTDDTTPGAGQEPEAATGDWIQRLASKVCIAIMTRDTRTTTSVEAIEIEIRAAVEPRLQQAEEERDGLLERLRQAEAEREQAKRWAAGVVETMILAQNDRGRLKATLEEFADPSHWAYTNSATEKNRPVFLSIRSVRDIAAEALTAPPSTPAPEPTAPQPPGETTGQRLVLAEQARAMIEAWKAGGNDQVVVHPAGHCDPGRDNTEPNFMFDGVRLAAYPINSPQALIAVEAMLRAQKEKNDAAQ